MSLSVGVDIGASGVRVVGVNGVDADGYALIAKLGFSPLPPGAVAAGKVQNTQQVALALGRALKDARVAPYGFVLGIASPDVALNRIQLPHSIRRHERIDAIRGLAHTGKFELSPNVPATSAALSTQLVRTDRTGEGHDLDTITVAGVSETDLAALRAVCKVAGCEPKALDLSGAAVVRALVRDHADSLDVSTIVDVGASKITIVTRQGLHVRALRTTAGAGEVLTRAIVAVLPDSEGQDQSELLEKAESRKHLMRLTSGRTGQLIQSSSYLDEDDAYSENEAQRTAVEATLNRSADQLIETIATTVESEAHSRGPGGSTRGITLCGGTALLRGFKDKLEQRVGVPVLVGKPWARPVRSRHTAALFDAQGVDQKVLLSLTTAIGLGLWKEAA